MVLLMPRDLKEKRSMTTPSPLVYAPHILQHSNSYSVLNAPYQCFIVLATVIGTLCHMVKGLYELS